MQFLPVVHEHQPLPEQYSPLSAREHTVLYLSAWGYTNKEIGSGLGLSVKTIESHKAKGARKLSLAGRSALIRYAVDHSWLMRERHQPSIVQP